MSYNIESKTQPISGEYPELPELKEVITSLHNLLSEIESLNEDSHDSLVAFYYPLVAVVYRISKISLEKYKLFPSNAQNPELEKWFWVCLRAAGQVLNSTIARMNPADDPVYDQLLIAYLDEYSSEPFQWNSVTLTWIAQWISCILKRENYRGNPPFYIYITGTGANKFPRMLPRILEGTGWVSGFNGRLLTLPGALKMTDAQKAEVWNQLLVSENIYGNSTIDHSVRERVFEAMYAHFPQGETRHLDLCGGKGDFVLWLRNKPSSQVTSNLIDIADEAVALAQESGIAASVGSAEQKLVVEDAIDVVTIVFAVQWISKNAFSHVLEVLKPGGMVVLNVYPPDQKRVETLNNILKQTGFINIKFEEVVAKNDKAQYIVWAEKPKS